MIGNPTPQSTVLIFAQQGNRAIGTTLTNLINTSFGQGVSSLPAGALAAGCTLRLTARGYINTDAARLLTLAFTIGSITITVTPTTGTDTNQTFSAEVILTCNSSGVSGTSYASVFLSYENSAITGISNAVVDTTIAEALQLNLSLAGGGANVVTVENVLVEFLRVGAITL